MSSACDRCLRRSALIGALAPSIAGLLDRPRDRTASLLALSDEELVEATAGGRREAARRFLAGFDADGERERLDGLGVEPVCRHDPGYPSSLEELRDPPATLFARGRPGRLGSLLEEPAVAIVGARNASPYGLEVAHELGRGLGVAGVSVVSGLALGIDAAAHKGTLAGGGGALAVLACGADTAYPRRHRELYERICDAGVVISEVPPGTRPFKWSFPARNRIMAGLAEVVVVVEAAESSGSLITATFAMDIGRTVAAVPGQVTSRRAAGSNRLLCDGATPVRGAEDVLDLVFGVGAGPREARGEVSVDPPLWGVLEAVEVGEEPGPATGLSAKEVRAALGRLEVMGLVRRDGIGGYVRTARS